MKQSIVALADAWHARIFTVEPGHGRAGVIEPRLIERVDLVNPGRRQPVGSRLTDSRPGSRRSSGSAGQAHAVDDHRDAWLREDDRRFAVEVCSALNDLARERPKEALLVVAPSRFLGVLRDGLADSLDAVFIARNLTNLSPTDALAHIETLIR